MKRVKVGDVAVLGQFNERLVIAHYLLADPRHGPFVQLYQCDPGWTIEMGLERCEPLWAPVLVGIVAAVKAGRWKVLGNIAPGPFVWGKYLMYGGKTNWWVFDGKREKRLGEEVPL